MCPEKLDRLTDTTVDTSDLNKTFKELGYKANEGEPMMEGLLNGTLLSAIAPPTRGITIQGTNKVYIAGSYFNEPSAAIRGKTIVHELLHVYFKNSHVQVARGLGLDIQHDYQSERFLQSDGTVDNLGTPNLKTVVYPVDKNDFPASQMINAWLLNNCGRGHKKK